MPGSPTLRRRQIACGLAWTACALVACACAPPIAAIPYPSAAPPPGVEAAASPASALSYYGRTVDLAAWTGILGETPRLLGAELVHADLSDGLVVLVDRDTAPPRLRVLDLGDLGDRAAASARTIDPAAAPTITPSAPLPPPLALARPRGGATLWLLAGDPAAARLWTLDLGAAAGGQGSGGALQAVTEAAILGLGVAADGLQVAYLARAGERTCLLLHSPPSAPPREVFCDGRDGRPGLTLAPVAPRFTGDGRGITVAAVADGRLGALTFDLTATAAPAPRLDAPPRGRRGHLEPIAGELADGRGLMIADDDGRRELYAYDRGRGTAARPLLRLGEAVDAAAILSVGVLIASATATHATITLVDPATGRILGQDRQVGAVDLLAASGERALWRRQAPDRPPALFLGEFTPAPSAGDPPSLRLTALSADDRAELPCRAELRTLTGAGTQASIDAFILEPQRPWPTAEPRRAVIRVAPSRRYNPADQVLCAAGITVITPVLGPAITSPDTPPDTSPVIPPVTLDALARGAAAELGLAPWQLGLAGEGAAAAAVFDGLNAGTFPYGFGLAHDPTAGPPAPRDPTPGLPPASLLLSQSPDAPRAAELRRWWAAAASARGLPVTQVAIPGGEAGGLALHRARLDHLSALAPPAASSDTSDAAPAE